MQKRNAINPQLEYNNQFIKLYSNQEIYKMCEISFNKPNLQTDPSIWHTKNERQVHPKDKKSKLQDNEFPVGWWVVLLVV